MGKWNVRFLVPSIVMFFAIMVLQSCNGKKTNYKKYDNTQSSSNQSSKVFHQKIFHIKNSESPNLTEIFEESKNLQESDFEIVLGSAKIEGGKLISTSKDGGEVFIKNKNSASKDGIFKIIFYPELTLKTESGKKSFNVYSHEKFLAKGGVPPYSFSFPNKLRCYDFKTNPPKELDSSLCGKIDAMSGDFFSGEGVHDYYRPTVEVKDAIGNTASFYIDSIGFNPGTLDESFADKGVATLDSSYEYDVTKMAITNDKKFIYTVNYQWTRSDERKFVIKKMSPNGEIIKEFGNNQAKVEIVTQRDHFFEDAFDMKIQSDGKILLLFDKSIRRFLPNGDEDKDYGDNGIVSMENSPRAWSLLSDDSTIVGFDFDKYLLKVNSNGKLDTSWGSAGKVVLPPSFNFSRPYLTFSYYFRYSFPQCMSEIKIDDQKKIFVTGKRMTEDSSGRIINTDISVLCFEESGKVCSNFGEGGEAKIHIQHYPYRSPNDSSVSKERQQEGYFISEVKDLPNKIIIAAMVNKMPILIQLTSEGKLDICKDSLDHLPSDQDRSCFNVDGFQLLTSLSTAAPISIIPTGKFSYITFAPEFLKTTPLSIFNINPWGETSHIINTFEFNNSQFFANYFLQNPRIFDYIKSVSAIPFDDWTFFVILDGNRIARFFYDQKNNKF